MFQYESCVGSFKAEVRCELFLQDETCCDSGAAVEEVGELVNYMF